MFKSVLDYKVMMINQVKSIPPYFPMRLYLVQTQYDGLFL